MLTLVTKRSHNTKIKVTVHIICEWYKQTKLLGILAPDPFLMHCMGVENFLAKFALLMQARHSWPLTNWSAVGVLVVVSSFISSSSKSITDYDKNSHVLHTGLRLALFDTF